MKKQYCGAGELQASVGTEHRHPEKWMAPDSLRRYAESPQTSTEHAFLWASSGDQDVVQNQRCNFFVMPNQTATKRYPKQAGRRDGGEILPLPPNTARGRHPLLSPPKKSDSTTRILCVSSCHAHTPPTPVRKSFVELQGRKWEI